jgi:hypothetical protein
VTTGYLHVGLSGLGVCVLILDVEGFYFSHFLEQCIESIVVIVVLLSSFQTKNFTTEQAVFFFTLY